MKLLCQFTRSRRLLGVLALISALNASANAADVLFYAVYKAQHSSGNNPFRGWAVVYPATSNSVFTSTLAPPGGASQALTYNPSSGAFELQDKFPTENALDFSFGTGKYTLTVNTAHDGSKSLPLNLPASNYPNAPNVSNSAAAQAIDPAADFTLTWEAFVGGTTNDYIDLLIGDSAGNLVFQTPRPWEAGALNGTATSVVIPATTLGPSQSYQAQLSFFRVTARDLGTYPGAIGAVAFASINNRFSLATIAPQVRFGLMLRHIVQGGDFADRTNLTAFFPAKINGYRVRFSVLDDTSYPEADAVLFTGPAGSGLTNTPGDPQASSITPGKGFYFSPKISSPLTAPAGTWTNAYKGTNYTFYKPDPQAALHLIIPLPTVEVSNNVLLSVSWSYRDANGLVLAGPPAFMTNIVLQVQDPNGAFLYQSSGLAPTTTNQLLTGSVHWSNVAEVRLIYGDDLGNSFLVIFNTVPPPQLTAIGFGAGGEFELNLSGVAGHTYLIQASSELAHLTAWTNVVTTNLPAAKINLFDSQPGSVANRFYRAKLVN